VEHDLSWLVAAADNGDGVAADALFAALYAELHRLASRQLARSAPHLTLGTTTLLHEAYLNVSRRDAAAFPDRARFMGYAAKVMRGLLIDYVRGRKAQKRGGLFEITALRTTVAGRLAGEQGLEQISEALDELATVDAELAQVVDLRFFCGFSFAEIGAMRGVSERTVQRHWEKARLYLHRAIAVPDAVQNLVPAHG
jgi:RNA polymerase sigma factor (TIGR02999 family)